MRKISCCCSERRDFHQPQGRTYCKRETHKGGGRVVAELSEVLDVGPVLHDKTKKLISKTSSSITTHRESSGRGRNLVTVRGGGGKLETNNTRTVTLKHPENTAKKIGGTRKNARRACLLLSQAVWSCARQFCWETQTPTRIPAGIRPVFQYEEGRVFPTKCDTRL